MFSAVYAVLVFWSFIVVLSKNRLSFGLYNQLRFIFEFNAHILLRFWVFDRILGY